MLYNIVSDVHNVIMIPLHYIVGKPRDARINQTHSLLNIDLGRSVRRSFLTEMEMISENLA